VGKVLSRHLYPKYTDRVYRNFGHRCRDNTLPTAHEYYVHINECVSKTEKEQEDAEMRDSFNVDNYLNHQIEDQGYASDPDRDFDAEDPMNHDDELSTAYDNFEPCEYCHYDDYYDEWYPCQRCDCYCYDRNGVPYDNKCLNCIKWDEDRETRRSVRKESGRYEPKIKIISNSDDSKRDTTSTDISSDQRVTTSNSNSTIQTSSLSFDKTTPDPIDYDDWGNPPSLSTTSVIVESVTSSSDKSNDSSITSNNSSTISIDKASDKVPPPKNPKWQKKETNSKQKVRGNPNVKTSHTSKAPKVKRKSVHERIYDQGTQDGKSAKRRLINTKMEKIKKGLQFKSGHKSGVNKEAKLLNQAYRQMNDQKFAELSAKSEVAETELDNLQYPRMDSEYYDNYYKEREFMKQEKADLDAEKKKKTYANNEIHVNKAVNNMFNDWNSSEMTEVVRFANTVKDLEKVESFLKENIHDEEAVIEIVNSVAGEIAKQPNLMDKISNFLKDLIRRVKPLAFTLDTLREIPLSINILDDETKVFVGEAIKIGELQDQFEPGKNVDVRDDNMRRGDLVHMDPILRRCIIQRVVRKGPISTSYDFAGVFSGELLFQLLSPSVCQMNVSEDIVKTKMQHVAATIHTINLPKMANVMCKCDIVDVTLNVAWAIYKTRRRVSQALGFCAPQQ